MNGVKQSSNFSTMNEIQSTFWLNGMVCWFVWWWLMEWLCCPFTQLRWLRVVSYRFSFQHQLQSTINQTNQFISLLLNQLTLKKSKIVELLLKKLKVEWKREIVWVCWGRKSITHYSVIKKLCFLWRRQQTIQQSLISFNQIKSFTFNLISFNETCWIEWSQIIL